MVNRMWYDWSKLILKSPKEWQKTKATEKSQQNTWRGIEDIYLVCALSSFSMRVGWGLKTNSISLAPSITGSIATVVLLLSSSSPESSDVLVLLLLGPASWLLCVEALLQCELSPLSSAPLPFSICCFLPLCNLIRKKEKWMWISIQNSPNVQAHTACTPPSPSLSRQKLDTHTHKH